MFVDSSALVAMIAPEDDGPDVSVRLQARSSAITSPLVVFETVMALRRLRRVPLSIVQDLVVGFLAKAGVRTVDMSADIHRLALVAQEKFGKGSGHPAQLNMGDCFSYAMARQAGVPLLYKGGDFALTDLA
jgi:ribonuclease VapC